MQAVATALDAAGAPVTDRVMSIDASGYRYWTGHPGVVLVNDPLDTVEQVARAYGIRWLVLEPKDSVAGGARDPRRRPAARRGSGRRSSRRDGVARVPGLPRRRRHPLPDRAREHGPMSRREAWLTALAVFAVALAVRIVAASIIDFPKPEDTAYYVGVARNLVEGRGLVSDALWSYGTPPLVFPRPAFEVWLPLPSLLAAIPMALCGRAAPDPPRDGDARGARWSPVLAGAIVARPRLAARGGRRRWSAACRSAGRGRSRSGPGSRRRSTCRSLLHSALPDSTMLFGALVLGAALLMTRVLRDPRGARVAGRPPARDRPAHRRSPRSPATRPSGSRSTWAWLAWRAQGRDARPSGCA